MDGMNELIRDLPKGPLDLYRKKASFDFKLMRLFLEGEERIKYKNKLSVLLENDPLFSRDPNFKDLDEQRDINFRRMHRIIDYDFNSLFDYFENPYKFIDLLYMVGTYDLALLVKRSINYELFGTACLTAGEEKHQNYFSELVDFEVIGCFALTEMSHGSNAKGIKTTATFDTKTQEFVLNTPNLEAVKMWSGNLAKNATHGIIFARLIDAKGVDHGISMFVAPLRSLSDFRPLPGITIGDMGPKVGLNGIDNGFAIFNNFRIPKNSLLNRNGYIDENGIYQLKEKRGSKKFNANLGMLSIGRVGINLIAVLNLRILLTIAIRYSAVRRQFNNSETADVNLEELPIIEYQMQRYRLFPYLATCYALTCFSEWLLFRLIDLQSQIQARPSDPAQLKYLESFGKEIHAVSCATKAVATWTAQAAAQECREACGGHGYLHSARIGDIRNDNDANCTYEGDNNVILEQSSNYILQVYQMYMDKNNDVVIKTPMNSLDFIPQVNQFIHYKFQSKTSDQLIQQKEWLNAFDWLISTLTVESSKRVSTLKSISKPNTSNVEIKNNSQIFYCRDLAIVYAHRLILKTFNEFVSRSTVPHALQPVLRRLYSLYGLSLLEKHLGIFYQYGYMNGEHCGRIIKEGILQLCDSLKYDSVSLVDSFGITDFMLNSSLGSADGKVYEHIYAKMLQTKNVFERPDYWNEYLNFRNKISMPKL